MTIFIALPGNEALARSLAEFTGGRAGRLATRRFPDGESYVRILDPLDGEDVHLVCTLADPDAKVLPLLLAAGAARDGGARSVRLIAPYLAYMRQDWAFAPGEAVSARHFAALLSGVFDAILTLDPHLHRLQSLGEIFGIRTQVAHAAPLLAQWVADQVAEPFIIGPDTESRQWAQQVAEGAHAPYAVLQKVRHGDRNVELQLPDLSGAKGRLPVLIDDIISSGATMVQAAEKLQALGFPPPVCLAVHGVFAAGAFERLKGASQTVVTTDSIPHPSNGISIAHLLAAELKHL